LVARQFGSFTAALTAVGLQRFIRLPAGFSPVRLTIAVWLAPLRSGACAVLAYFCGKKNRATDRQPKDRAVIDPAVASRRATAAVFYPGIAGGLGLWVSTPTMAPILMGLALGEYSRLDCVEKPKSKPSGSLPVAPWRRGRSVGDDLPGRLSHRIFSFPHGPATAGKPSAVTDWLGSAWVSCCDLQLMVEPGKIFLDTSSGILLLLAVAAIAALPFAMAQTGALAFLTADPSASRLTSLPTGWWQKTSGLDRSRRATGAVLRRACPCC